MRPPARLAKAFRNAGHEPATRKTADNKKEEAPNDEAQKKDWPFGRAFRAVRAVGSPSCALSGENVGHDGRMVLWLRLLFAGDHAMHAGQVIHVGEERMRRGCVFNRENIMRATSHSTQPETSPGRSQPPGVIPLLRGVMPLDRGKMEQHNDPPLGFQGNTMTPLIFSEAKEECGSMES
jgi:hypothetical protein